MEFTADCFKFQDYACESAVIRQQLGKSQQRATGLWKSLPSLTPKKGTPKVELPHTALHSGRIAKARPLVVFQLIRNRELLMPARSKGRGTRDQAANTDHGKVDSKHLFLFLFDYVKSSLDLCASQEIKWKISKKD